MESRNRLEQAREVLLPDFLSVQDNYKWFKTTMQSILAKKGMDIDEYLVKLLKGAIPFDEGAILLFARATGLHFCVILNDEFWCTNYDNECEKWAGMMMYCGNLKFLDTTEGDMELADCYELLNLNAFGLTHGSSPNPSKVNSTGHSSEETVTVSEQTEQNDSDEEYLPPSKKRRKQNKSRVRKQSAKVRKPARQKERKISSCKSRETTTATVVSKLEDPPARCTRSSNHKASAAQGKAPTTHDENTDKSTGVDGSGETTDKSSDVAQKADKSIQLNADVDGTDKSTDRDNETDKSSENKTDKSTDKENKTDKSSENKAEKSTDKENETDKSSEHKTDKSKDTNNTTDKSTEKEKETDKSSENKTDKSTDLANATDKSSENKTDKSTDTNNTTDNVTDNNANGHTNGVNPENARGTKGHLEVKSYGIKKTVTKDRRHKCQHCDNTFSLVKELNSHFRDNHPDQSFKCHVCDRTYSSKNALDRHAKVHTGLQFICGQCPFACQFRYEMRDHLKKHTGTQKWPCPRNDCNLSFASKRGLNQHMAVHTPDTFYCDHCPKTFNTKGYLRQHLHYHTGGFPTYCGFKAKNPTAKQNHQKACDDCKQKKPSKLVLATAKERNTLEDLDSSSSSSSTSSSSTSSSSEEQ